MKEEKQFLAAQLMIFEIPIEKRSFRDYVWISTFNQECEKEMAKFAQDMNENDQNCLNVKQVTDIEKYSEELYELIKQNTEYYTELCTFYQKNNLPLNEFMIKSYKFEKEAEKIQRIWAKMSAQNDNLPSYISVLYSTYISLVRNVPSQAEKIYSRIVAKQEKIIDGVKHQNIDSSDIIFYLSMSKERLGRVVHVSRNIYKELGWFRAEILKQNVNVIQPPFIREKHNQILSNHKENQKIYLHNQKKAIWSQLMVRSLLIVRSNGVIDSFSKGLAKELGLESYSMIHINQICSEFQAAMDKFNGKGPRSPEVPLFEERILNFRAISSNNEYLGNKEVSYRVQSKELSLLGEQYLILYLSPQRTLEKTFAKQKTKLLTKNSNNFEDMLADDIPAEFIPSAEGIMRKFSETRLFTQSPSVQKPKESINYTTTQSFLTKKTENLVQTTYSHVDQIQLLISQLHEMPKIKQYQSIEKEILAKKDSQVSSFTSKKKEHLESKIEQAVYFVPKSKNIRILNIQTSFFCNFDCWPSPFSIIR